MRKSEEPKRKEGMCSCPYCEGEVAVAPVPCCQPCGVTLHYCKECQIAVTVEATVCPECGRPLE